MLKLNPDQASAIGSTTYAIKELEESKNHLEDRDYLLRLRVEFRPQDPADPFGRGHWIDIAVPAAEIRRQIDAKIADAHRHLEALGVELKA